MPKAESMKRASTAADVLKVSLARRVELIKGLEPWGLTLYMRSMTEREKAAYEFELIDPKTGEIKVGRLKQSRAKLVSLVVSDEAGNLLFGESQVRELEDRDGKLVHVLNEQCREHVGLGKPSEKNSDSTDDDDSPLDSPSTSAD